MISSVGLEVMNSTSPELNWKTVTKGRRSRKSVARSLNGVAKVGNSISPKRVGDFSGSDSDKFGDAVFGQSASGKSESVPIKKRRHLLQSPCRETWTPPALCGQDSGSLQTSSSSPFSVDHEQLPHPASSSGQKSSNWPLRGIDGSAEVRFGRGFDSVFLCDLTKHEEIDAGDFSGIELLAAAASMDDDAENANKEDLVAEDPLIPKNSDESSSAKESKLGLKMNESENSLSNITEHVDNTDCTLVLDDSAGASQSLCESTEDSTMPKVSRHHWDLNTPMDAWDEPYDDSVAGGASKDVNDDMHHLEQAQKGSRDHLLSNPGGTKDEPSNLKMEENKSTAVSPDRMSSEPPSLKELLQEPARNSYSTTAMESSDQATTAKDVDEKNSNHVSSSDAQMETPNVNTDATLDSSCLTMRCLSGMATFEEKINPMPSTVVTSDEEINPMPSTVVTSDEEINRMPGPVVTSEEKISPICGPVAIFHDECFSGDVNKYERTAASDRVQTRTEDGIAHDMPASETCESVIDAPLKDIEASPKTSELPGTFIQDGKPVLTVEANTRNDQTVTSVSMVADCQVNSEPAELLTKHENNNERSKTTMMDDSSKSCSAGTRGDDPTTSVGKVGSAIDSRHDSNVSQDNHVRMHDGDDLTGFQEGYDSPYEDGELRGSFFYSLEYELENECVDYESDGRNGDGSDGADYPGSEVVEVGSEGSHGTERRSLLVKKISEGSRSGPAKHSLRRHFINDDSDNNEVAGKGSNAGSGTTVEQSMEMVIEENDDGMKRRQLTERRDGVDDVKVTQMDEFVSKTARGKLQSRVEGRSVMGASDGKDLFMQQCRSRRFSGTYPRPERDISSDKYQGRYRSVNHDERDEIHPWTSWGSRRRYNSNYQTAEGRSHTRPRSIIGDSKDKVGGLDYHDPRQTDNYLSKGIHRPFIRRSPVERDDYFTVRRRMPLTRGVSNYRSRGYYSQRGAREFGEHVEPLPEDTGAPVRMPPYLSRRERSFSPSSGKGGHMPLTRRRSRSRSRTHSPKPWHSHRERVFCNRRQSRSPDFRPEARMDRVRMPFPKPTFGSDYGEDYFSPSRGRFSPQRNCRWVDDHPFVDNHLRRRRSPVRVFRRTQRFDPVGSSGRMKSDEYFRPMVRPRRFSYLENGDRRHDGNGGMMMHRGMQSDGENPRRFRHNASNDFETSNLNNEDDVRVSNPRDAPQTQSDRNDKRAFKI